MSKSWKERAPIHGQTGRQLPTTPSGKSSTADMSTDSASSSRRGQRVPGATGGDAVGAGIGEMDGQDSISGIHELDEKHVLDSFNVFVHTYSKSEDGETRKALWNSKISEPEWKHFKTLSEFKSMVERLKKMQMQLVDEETKETKLQVHISVYGKYTSNMNDTTQREFRNISNHMSSLHFHVPKPMVDDVMRRLTRSKFHEQGHGSVHHTTPTTLTIVASVNHDDEVFKEARNIVYYAKMEKNTDSMNVEEGSTLSRGITETKSSNEECSLKHLKEEAAQISEREIIPEFEDTLSISPSLNEYLKASKEARELVVQKLRAKQLTCKFDHDSSQIIFSGSSKGSMQNLETNFENIVREEVVELEKSTVLQVYGIDETISMIQENIKDPEELTCLPEKEKLTLIGTVSGFDKAGVVLEEMEKELTKLHLFVSDLSRTMMDDFRQKADVLHKKYGHIFIKRDPPYVKVVGRSKAVEKFKELLAGCLKEETFEMKAEAQALLISSKESEHFLVKQAEQEYLEVGFDLEKALYIVRHTGESTFDPKFLTTWYKTKSIMVSRSLQDKSEAAIRKILAESEDVDDSKVLVVLEDKRLTLTATADEYPKAERVIEDIRLGRIGENRAEGGAKDQSGHDGKDAHVEGTVDSTAADDAHDEGTAADDVQRGTREAMTTDSRARGERSQTPESTENAEADKGVGVDWVYIRFQAKIQGQHHLDETNTLLDAYSWKYLKTQTDWSKKLEKSLQERNARIINIEEPEPNKITITVEADVELRWADVDVWRSKVSEAFNSYSVMTWKKVLRIQEEKVDDFVKRLNHWSNVFWITESNGVFTIITDCDNGKGNLIKILKDFEGFLIEEPVSLQASGMTNEPKEKSTERDKTKVAIVLSAQAYNFLTKHLPEMLSPSSWYSAHDVFAKRKLVVIETDMDKGAIIEELKKLLHEGKVEVNMDDISVIMNIQGASPVLVECSLSIEEKLLVHESPELQEKILLKLLKNDLVCEVEKMLMIWHQSDSNPQRAVEIIQSSLKTEKLDFTPAKEIERSAIRHHFEKDHTGLVKVTIDGKVATISFMSDLEPSITQKIQNLEDDYFIECAAEPMSEDMIEYYLRYCKADISKWANMEVEIKVSCPGSVTNLEQIDTDKPGFYLRGTKGAIRQVQQEMKNSIAQKLFPLEGEDVDILKSIEGQRFLEEVHDKFQCSTALVNKTTNTVRQDTSRDIHVEESGQKRLRVVTGYLDEWCNQVNVLAVPISNQQQILQVIEKYDIGISANSVPQTVMSQAVYITDTSVGENQMTVAFFKLHQLTDEEAKEKENIRGTISKLCHQVCKSDRTVSILFPTADIYGIIGPRGMKTVIFRLREMFKGNLVFEVVLFADHHKTGSEIKQWVMNAAQHDRFESPLKRRLEVKKMELTKAKADVLVNTTDRKLTLDNGAVSKSLLNAAGSGIQKECRKYKTPLHYGEIAETSGGNIPACRAIYHGALPQIDTTPKSKEKTSKDECFQILKEFMKGCLFKACDSGYRSIAFPVIGTGNLGYPCQDVSSIMFYCVHKFFKDHPNVSLQTVLFVTYAKDHYPKFLAEKIVWTCGIPQNPEREKETCFNLTESVMLQVAEATFDEVMAAASKLVVVLEHSTSDEFLRGFEIEQTEKEKVFKALVNSYKAVTGLRGVEVRFCTINDRITDCLKKEIKQADNMVVIYARTSRVVQLLAKYLREKSTFPEDTSVISLFFPNRKLCNEFCSMLSEKIPRCDITKDTRCQLMRGGNHVGAVRVTARTMETVSEAYKAIMKYFLPDSSNSKSDNAPDEPEERKSNTRCFFLESDNNHNIKDTWQIFKNPQKLLDEKPYVLVCPIEDEKHVRKQFSGLQESNLMSLNTTVSLTKDVQAEFSETELKKFGLKRGKQDRLEGTYIQILAAMNHITSKRSTARSTVSKPDSDSYSETLELESAHYEAMKRFIQAENLIRECTTEKLSSGKVKVKFSQSKDAEGIKGRVNAFNTDQVEIAKANQSDCKQFFQSTMEELPKVYMQLSDDGKTVTIISEDWGEMSAAKKKVQIKFGSHKPKSRSHRHFASSAQQPSASENQSENVDNPCTSDKSGEHIDSNVPDKSLSVGCLDVYIYKANMTTLRLDAIVNAANGRLSHGSGLARAIADAAGRDLDDEGSLYIRNNGEIPVAGVVRTTAGNLPCKMVLHAVGPYWSDYKDYEKTLCSDDLCMTVLRCLIEADRHGAKDVAIPSISSGIYRVPHSICCAAYVRGVRLFGELCQPRTLKRAHFVDINDGMLTKIQDQFVRCKGQPLHATEQENKFIKRYTDQGAVPKQSKLAANFDHPLDTNVTTKEDTTGSYSYRVKDTKTSVKLYCGDLTKVKADGVVSWENSKMEPATQDSILLREAAGQPERMYNKNLLEVFTTTPGRLNKVKKILHVIVPVSTMSLSDLGQVHERIFGTAEVSAPVLALSLLELRKVQLEESAAGFCKSLTEHVTAENGGIKEVHVIDNRPGYIAKIKKIFDINFQIEGSEFDGFEVVPVPDQCSICHDVISDEKTLNKCEHKFCQGCIDGWFKEKPVCPICGVIYGAITGTMPPGIMSVNEDRWSSLPGFYGGKYTITYNIKGGYQTAEHPNPGQRYKGAYWTAYLPKNKEGETVLRLLKVAFRRRLTFTVGRSTTTGEEDKVTWNDIHHKTSIGANKTFGYPDKGYLQRVTDELASKGVTETDIDWSVHVTQSVFVT